MSSVFQPRTLPVMTKNLLVINLIIFAVMALSPLMDAKMQTYAALHYFSSPGFRPWQLVSYMFVHANFMHLLFNMLALYFFGPLIERVMGRDRFLLFYITCGVGAALLQEGVFAVMLSRYTSLYGSEAVGWVIDRSWGMLQYNNFDLSAQQVAQGVKYGVLTLGAHGYDFVPAMYNVIGIANQAVLGASGAIFGILGATAILFPNMRVYLYFAIPVKMKWLAIGYAVLELFQGMGNYASTVAHFAHIGGMAVGVLMVLYWKKKGVFNNLWMF